MAKYPINKKGKDSLEQLKKDLGSLSDSIQEKGKALSDNVLGISEDLGKFENDILTLVSEVNSIESSARDSIDILNEMIQGKINKIDTLMQKGLV